MSIKKLIKKQSDTDLPPELERTITHLAQLNPKEWKAPGCVTYPIANPLQTVQDGCIYTVGPYEPDPKRHILKIQKPFDKTYQEAILMGHCAVSELYQQLTTGSD
ncbi:MAG: hypothetical protein ACQESG_03935 [Nanobdellota archaeon]